MQLFKCGSDAQGRKPNASRSPAHSELGALLDAAFPWPGRQRLLCLLGDSVGPLGSVGSVGSLGLVGSVGPVGLVGSVGPVGSVGSVGSVGLVGPVGSLEHRYHPGPLAQHFGALPAKSRQGKEENLRRI